MRSATQSRASSAPYPRLRGATLPRRPYARDAAAGFVVGALAGQSAARLGAAAVLGLSEVGLMLIAAVVATVLALTRLRVVVWTAAAGAVLLTLLVAYTPLIAGPARALVRADSLGQRPVEAVVVLSSGVSEDGLVDAQGLQRLLSGLALVRRGMSVGAEPALVLTRVERPTGDGRVTSEPDQRALVALLGGPMRVGVVAPVHSTRDEALRTAELARRAGWRTVAVVTSPLHTRRACATFERVGLSVVCVPSEERSFALRHLRTPGDRLEAFSYWLYETLGWLEYRRRGWV